MEKIYSVFEGFLFVVPEVESADCESRLLHEDDEESAQARVHVHRNRVLQHHREIILYYRVPGCLSLRPICLPPPHLPQACPPPLGTKEGEGAGGANSDEWRESLALCILVLCA